MHRYIVLYVTVIDGEEDTLHVLGPYIGGIMDTKDKAEDLARDLTNDRSLPGVVMTKLYCLDDTFKKIYTFAIRQFRQMADEMIDMHRVQRRMKKR